MKPMRTRFLVVDDHAMFRAGLRSLLQSQYADAELAEAGDGRAAIECARQFRPQIILLDLHLPGLDGIEVTRQILAFLPAKIILLSADSNLAYVSGALKAGAMAYLLKTSSPEELPRAVSAVLEGKLYLCHEANAAVLDDYRRGLAGQLLPRAPLSTRETEVLRFIADGLRTKEIAARLEVGVKTVETYRGRLMKKLDCGGTADLVRYAMREGIVQP